MLAAALPLAAQAHRLSVFASTEGAVVRGSVYFQGMIAARNAPVTVLDSEGALLAETVADDAGRFAFEATRRIDHHIIADLSDGHRAAFVVAAAQLPASLPELPAHLSAPSQAPSRMNNGAVAATDTDAAPQAGTSAAAIEAIVEAAVARHVGPLRQQIAAYEDKIRWHDVLGGIGYIVGMTGLACYFLARRERARRGTAEGIAGENAGARKHGG